MFETGFRLIKNRCFLYILCLFSFLLFPGCSGTAGKCENKIYQTSTINALFEGCYDGSLSCGELKKHGNFGIGTFNRLDGEMLVLDGEIYQIRSDGKAYKVNDNVQTPFAAVVFFEPEKRLKTGKIESFKELQKRIDSCLGSENHFFAFKITGTFDYIKTRSVPAQKKPYPRLVEVAKNQPVFEFENIEGTLIGYKCPEFVKGVNVTGWHLHFIDKGKTRGGHLLEVKGNNLSVVYDKISSFELRLENSSDFSEKNISRDLQHELKKVE